jgi:transcriptional regulator with XRE-family HTH domain
MTTAPDNDTFDWRDLPDLAAIANDMTFGKLLRTWRVCENLTQTNVAKQLGVSTQMVSQYETGKRLPSIREAVRLAELLGFSAGQAIRFVLAEQIAQAGVGNYKVMLEKVG